MRQIKESKFIDKESGITSEMVSASQDINELLNWKMVIHSNIVSSQMKIDEARGEQAKSGTYLDPKKWVGINGYRRVLGFLSQKIQYRLRELHYDNSKKSRPLHEYFYIEASHILDTDLFMEIKAKAQLRRDEDISSKETEPNFNYQ